MGPHLPRPMMAAGWERVPACPESAGRQQSSHYPPPVVPNPHTLLSQLPPTAMWFTCLDLKDAISCIPVAASSQPIFAFEWKDPHTAVKTQLTWTRLPQEFKNSPTLFGEALAGNLKPLAKGGMDLTILQHMDNLFLVASPRNGAGRECTCC
ncbi:hypothetical protein HJG60_009311 [Phyllostomus discolor]|uniref:Reverse transcriptase domain-containing protein n=1 Tax=Phyllostomus discolor TaxID=89673 RepID=A0A833YKK0_9CHIR|nr:hypothetical protein HJG60_009311 [Phyllostomus discolor]